ncbi:hypothetical protein BJ878DRAFT_550976 [Calycina marina]|uniref:Uncharacterized protein n=1 Tax=Calycina marina TaxID=1763456 RepID=A0A9P7Z2H9_9HELO|nr:hypothetical protein BJ878DRAFT_550976 [Calycina marina]
MFPGRSSSSAGYKADVEPSPKSPKSPKTPKPAMLTQEFKGARSTSSDLHSDPSHKSKKRKKNKKRKRGKNDLFGKFDANLGQNARSNSKYRRGDIMSCLDEWQRNLLAQTRKMDNAWPEIDNIKRRTGGGKPRKVESPMRESAKFGHLKKVLEDAEAAFDQSQVIEIYGEEDVEKKASGQDSLARKKTSGSSSPAKKNVTVETAESIEPAPSD